MPSNKTSHRGPSAATSNIASPSQTPANKLRIFMWKCWVKGTPDARPHASPGSVDAEPTVDAGNARLQYCATLKTATVRELRNNYTSVLRWVSAGEDVLITQRGVVIARLSPETAKTADSVDWASSPEVLRDRSGDVVLSAEQSAEMLTQAGGRW